MGDDINIMPTTSQAVPETPPPGKIKQITIITKKKGLGYHGHLVVRKTYEGDPNSSGLPIHLLTGFFCPDQPDQDLWLDGLLPLVLQNIQWSVGLLLYLRICLYPGHLSPPVNWQQLEVRVFEWLQTCAGLLQCLFLHGKALVTNQLILSMLWHCLNTLAMPLQLLASLQRWTLGVLLARMALNL